MTPSRIVSEQDQASLLGTAIDIWRKGSVRVYLNMHAVNIELGILQHHMN